jgi:hypothetical protein
VRATAKYNLKMAQRSAKDHSMERLIESGHRLSKIDLQQWQYRPMVVEFGTDL